MSLLFATGVRYIDNCRGERHARVDLQRHAGRGGEAAGGVYEGV